MLGLAESSKIKKIIPKKLIFEKFKKEFTNKRKNSFNEDIARLSLTNEISPHSLNIEEGKEIKNIFVLRIDVKKDEIDPSNISILARFFEQKILFVIAYENQGKLAIYEERLFATNYQAIEDLEIELEGLNLDSIWQNLVLNISGYKLEKERDLSEQIEIEEKRNRLKRQINRLDKRARRERQPSKSFEIFQEVKKLKKELEDL